MSPSSTRPPEEPKSLSSDAVALRSAERRSLSSSGDGLSSWSGLTTPARVEDRPLLDRLMQ